MAFGSIRKLTPRQLAALVILTAMAMVLSFVEFPLFPSAPWLRYDPSAIVVFIATLLYGPWLGILLAFLAWVPRLVSDPLGALMNIMAAVTVVLMLGLIYRAHPDRKHALIGALCGILLSLTVSVGLNFLVTPLYTGATLQQVASTMLPTVIPFNLLKLCVNCAVALISYRKLEQLLAEPDDNERLQG